MAARVLASSLVALRKSHQFRILFSDPFASPSFFFSNLLLPITSLDNVLCKAFGKQPAGGLLYAVERFTFKGRLFIHSTSSLDAADEVVAPVNNSKGVASGDGGDNAKVKRKKLKGKRAVVRWLKFFRYKKKKEYERMTAEEKILYKLRKAHKKEERLVEALKKIEPKESSETTHDPEILTPEEHFFYLKMGLKHKNYVPIGRRGIYQGVILNMHLHWKKHQTVKVIIKTFSPEEVKEIAAELARLTGGIVLDIHEEDTIIMYRGKNYSQPPTEIMSPRVTLSRKKALDKSKYRDGLRAVRRYIPKLEQDLQLLQTQTKSKPDSEAEAVVYRQTASPDNMQKDSISQLESTNVSSKLKEILDASKALPESDSDTDLDMASESEDLSDIFETDIETEGEEKAPLRLYLDAFEKFPAQSDTESDELETQLHKISVDSEKAQTSENHAESPDFDEVDRLFLRAASLLKKKKR